MTEGRRCGQDAGRHPGMHGQRAVPAGCLTWVPWVLGPLTLGARPTERWTMTCDEPLGRGRACAAKPSGSGRSPGCDDSVGLDVHRHQEHSGVFPPCFPAHVAFRDRGGCSHSRRLTTVSCPHRVGEGQGCSSRALPRRGLPAADAGTSGHARRRVRVPHRCVDPAHTGRRSPSVRRAHRSTRMGGRPGGHSGPGHARRWGDGRLTPRRDPHRRWSGRHHRPHHRTQPMGHERERSRAHRLERDGGGRDLRWCRLGHRRSGLAAQRFRLGGRGLPCIRGDLPGISRCRPGPRVP